MKRWTRRSAHGLAWLGERISALLKGLGLLIRFLALWIIVKPAKAGQNFCLDKIEWLNEQRGQGDD